MIKSKYVLYSIIGVLLCFLIWGVIIGSSRIIFIVFLTLLIYLIFNFIERFFKIRMSGVFKCLFYFFIFCSQVLGEILDFYKLISVWDNILHFSFGLLCTFVGFSIIRYVVFDSNVMKSLGAIVAVFSMCFSITMGSLWELFEYSMDKYFKCDMQKDEYVNEINTVLLGDSTSNKIFSIQDILYTNVYTSESVFRIDGGYLDIGINDTMGDVFINMLGGIVASILIYIYVCYPGEVNFVRKFIISIK